MGRYWIIAGGGLAFILVMTARPDPEIFTEWQRGQIAKKLPEGCQMLDLGQYADINRLVAVNCDRRLTNTLNDKPQAVSKAE